MYRSCIFCSAPLGQNESIERFPVGRALAFDAARGRLWAVCPRCARWNLAPIEERWEAIDEAERRFRDTRLRTQSENIGVARLGDGTRLVRVGAALAGELAAWRYGPSLARRRSRYLLGVGGLAAAGYATALLGMAVSGVGMLGAFTAWRWVVRPAVRGYRDAEVIHTLAPLESRPGARIHLRRGELRYARLQTGDDGGMELHLPWVAEEAPWAGTRVLRRTGMRTVAIPDSEARMVLGRAMVAVNERGARSRDLEHAVKVLDTAGSAEGYLAAAARRRQRLYGGSEVYDALPGEPNRVASLALEMALHEETERRAMEGELAALEAMWREAEQLAAIADRLPDDVPASDSPRLNG